MLSKVETANKYIYNLPTNADQSYMYVCLISQMVTLSAYVSDGIHEKDINVQNSKMSESNQQKKENVRFTCNNVCLRFLL